MIQKPDFYDRDIYTSDSDFPMPVEVVEGDVDLYYHMAWSMYLEIERNNAAGRESVFIVPVGPVFQYRRLVRMLRDRPLDLSALHLYFMDEYLDENDALIPEDSPLSFRGFVRRELIEPLGDTGGFSDDRVYFPDPARPEDYDRRLADVGGADVCYAGVGINGHLAFNEAEAGLSVEDFLSLGSRTLTLTRETITINSNTALRGAFERIPTRAVTVGFRQIMDARRLRIYLNRPWQGAVVRKLLFGEETAGFPASLARRHGDARLTITPEVARRHAFALK